MSKSFATSYVVPYRENVSQTPVQYCGGGNVVKLDFPWRGYGLDIGLARRSFINTGVRFSIDVPPAGKLMNSVQGVFIDNTDCASPVYLVALDTGHMVTCPDGSSAFFPIFTNDTEFILYIESIATPYENLQATRIFLTDKPLNPQSDAQFNEFIPTSQVSGKAAFATQVQGDQHSYGEIVYFAQYYETGYIQTPDIILIPAVPNTTIVLTHIHMAIPFFKSTNERSVKLRLEQNNRLSFKHGGWGRPYNTPGSGNPYHAPIVPANPPFTFSGMGMRLRGDQALYAYAMIGNCNPGSSGNPYDGTSTLIGDVSVVYARLDNPTT